MEATAVKNFCATSVFGILIAILLCPIVAFATTTEITEIMVRGSVDLAGINGSAGPTSRVRGAVVAIDPINEVATPGQVLTFERSGGIFGGVDGAFETAFEAVVTTRIPTLDEIALLPSNSSPFFPTTTFEIPATGFLVLNETIFSASGEVTEAFVTSEPLAADGVADLVSMNGEFRVTGFSLATVSSSPPPSTPVPTQPGIPAASPPVITAGGVSPMPVLPPFPAPSASTGAVPEPTSLVVWVLLLCLVVSNIYRNQVRSPRTA